MLQKIQALQKRLIAKTEEVVEKDLMIQVWIIWVRVRVRDGVRVRVKGSGCEGSARRTLLTITYAAPCEGCSNDALNSPPCLRTTWIRVSLGLGC